MERGDFIGKVYKIGELAEKAGVSKRTIDYYTQIGLLAAERSKANYRFYSEESLQRLVLIEIYKKERLTLEEIRERLKFLTDGEKLGEQVVERIDHLSQHFKQIEEEVLQLKPLLEKLDAKQFSLISKEVSLRGMSLMQTLVFILGENPFI